MTTELKPCKGCHRSKYLSQFDNKKDGTLKLTCRACLLTAKSRFKAQPLIAMHRDVKKLRMEIITAIHQSEDSQVLTHILTIAQSAIIQSIPKVPSAAVSPPYGTESTTDATSTSPHGTEPIAAQTPGQLQ